MTTILPDVVKAYRRTPDFDETNVPVALLRDHSTKQGTWGLLRVERGRLRYVVTDGRRPRYEVLLTPSSAPMVIEPTILHHVEPLGSVRFHVEFLR